MRSRTKDSQLELYSYLSLEPLITSITMLSICGGLSPAGMSFHMFIGLQDLSCRLFGLAILVFDETMVLVALAFLCSAVVSGSSCLQCDFPRRNGS